MHICTLKDEDESPWGDSMHLSVCQRIKRFIAEFTMVSLRNPRCRTYFKSKSTIAREKKRHIKLKLLHVIHPLSIFRMVWENSMLFIFLLALIFNPLDSSYNFSRDRDTYDFNDFVDTLIDLLCMIDIAISFHTGLVIEKTREIILDPDIIRKRYLYTYYVPDLLSSLPTAVLTYAYQVTIGDTGVAYIRLIALLKILRLVTLLEYLDRSADMLNLHEHVRKTVRSGLVTFLTIHWFACMHYFIPRIKYHLAGEPLSKNSWIVQAGIENLTERWEIHQYTFFRAASFLLGTHHGVYPILTDEDAIVGIISFLLGYLYLLYLVVVFLQIFMSRASSETKYLAIMNQLYQYMRYKQLPISMQKRLIAFYEYRFHKAYFRETVITETVSEKLRVEINVHCCRRLVNSVSLFKDLPATVISDVISKLKAEVFLPNDIIVRAGTVGDCMYFIAYGTVTVQTPTGKEVCHLQDGAYFGEIALVQPDQKRVADVIAIEICELYRLDRPNFLMCFSSCPEVFKKISVVAEERHQQTILMEEIHKKYLFEATTSRLRDYESGQHD